MARLVYTVPARHKSGDSLRRPPSSVRWTPAVAGVMVLVGVSCCDPSRARAFRALLRMRPDI